MKTETTYIDKGVETVLSLTPTVAAVKQAAKKLGWQDKVPDPAIQRQIELKQAEILALEPTDQARVTLRNELRALQQAASEMIDNPVHPEAVVADYIAATLEALLIDDNEINQEAQQFIEEQKELRRGEVLTRDKRPKVTGGPGPQNPR